MRVARLWQPVVTTAVTIAAGYGRRTLVLVLFAFQISWIDVVDLTARVRALLGGLVAGQQWLVSLCRIGGMRLTASLRRRTLAGGILGVIVCPRVIAQSDKRKAADEYKNQRM